MKAGAMAVEVAIADSLAAVNEAEAMGLEAGRWAKVGAKAVKVATAVLQVVVNEAEAMGQVGRWGKAVVIPRSG